MGTRMLMTLIVWAHRRYCSTLQCYRHGRPFIVRSVCLQFFQPFRRDTAVVLLLLVYVLLFTMLLRSMLACFSLGQILSVTMRSGLGENRPFCTASGEHTDFSQCC